MNIHQLSVSHDERQDRLLLRMNTQDRQEFRFWLTRRMACRLLPAMDQSLVRLEATQPGMGATDAASQHMLAEFKRDAFLKTADFSTPYTTAPQLLPLGDEPLLVTDAQLSLQPQGALLIIFQKKTGENTQSCQLNLQSSLVHGMIHLMRQSIAQADWGLLPQDAAKDSERPDSVAVNAKAYKH